MAQSARAAAVRCRDMAGPGRSSGHLSAHPGWEQLAAGRSKDLIQSLKTAVCGVVMAETVSAPLPLRVCLQGSQDC